MRCDRKSIVQVMIEPLYPMLQLLNADISALCLVPCALGPQITADVHNGSSTQLLYYKILLVDLKDQSS